MHKHNLTTYQKLCTEFYDLEQHKDGAQAVMFYTNYAQQANGPILEPMCGTGRFLIPILQLGLKAEGFDASSYMLEAFKQKYPNAPVWQQFIEDFNMNKLYSLSEIHSKIHSYQVALQFQNPLKVEGNLEFEDLLGSAVKSFKELEDMSDEVRNK